MKIFNNNFKHIRKMRVLYQNKIMIKIINQFKFVEVVNIIYYLNIIVHIYLISITQKFKKSIFNYHIKIMKYIYLMIIMIGLFI